MSTQLQEHAAQGQLLNDNAFEQLIQKEFKPKSKQAEDAVQEAVKTLAKQALTSVVQHSSDTYQTIEAIIAEIDKKPLTKSIRLFITKNSNKWKVLGVDFITW